MKLAFVSLFALHVCVLSGCSSAESRMIRGDSLFARGKYAEALAHYQSAQRKDPALVGIDEKLQSAELRMYLRRGDDAVQRGDWSEAERRYAEARRLDPSSDEVETRLRQMAEKRANEHFRRGQELLGRGNPFDAIGEFEQALTVQSDHPRASEALDRALEEKLDRERRAETAFQTGLRARASESLEEAIMNLTTALNENPHHPTAGRELEAVKLQFAESLMLEGDTEMSRKEWHLAVAFYRKAQTYNRRLPGLTRRLLRAQRADRAERLVKEGNQAFDKGDWRAALQRFSQARELASDREDFLTRYESARERLAAETYNVAEAEERKGRFRDAITKYRSIGEFYREYRDAPTRAERLDVRLRTAVRTYEAGSRAQEERDMQTARGQFRICADTIPGFRDVDERRKVVEDALRRAQDLYERAVRAESRDYERARVFFEECLSVATSFRDASERLDRMRDRLIEQAEVEQRYDEACRAQAAKDLERARKLFLSCERSRSGYRDVVDRLRDVENARNIAYEIHDRAAQSAERGVLKHALSLYEECLTICTPCRDASESSKRIRVAMKSLEKARKLERGRRLLEARKRYQQVLEWYGAHGETRRSLARIDNTLEQLTTGYEAMVDAQRKGKFARALSYAIGIRKKCAEFRDVDGRIPTLQSEVDYADGRALEASDQYEEAIRCFARCAERTVDFRDVKERLRACRAKWEKKKGAGKGYGKSYGKASGKGDD